MLLALPLHVVLGVVSLALIGLGLLDWLTPVVHRLLDGAFPDREEWSFVALYPIREEIAKGLMLVAGALVLASFPGLAIRTRVGPAFTVPALGVGMGFALVETAFSPEEGGFVATVVYRIWGHSLCVGWTALGLALAIRRRWWWAPAPALAVAMLVHGGNNWLKRHPEAIPQFAWVFGASVVLAVLCGLAQKDLSEWPPRWARRTPPPPPPAE